MTTITITIPDEISERVIQGLCRRFNYPYPSEKEAPESRTAFIERRLQEFIKESVATIEIANAVTLATEVIKSSVEADITPTVEINSLQN